MKKQYISPSVSFYTVENSKVLCSSTIDYGGQEGDGTANTKDGLDDDEFGW